MKRLINDIRYGLLSEKMMATFIIGFIMATFSLFICMVHIVIFF